MLVTVDTAAARLLRVIQVEHLQPIEPHDSIEIVERRRVAFLGTQIVSGGQQVTRVQANTNAKRSIHMRENRCQVLETVPQVCPLPGRVFENHFRAMASPGFQQFGYRAPNGAQSILLSTCRVRPWVHYQAIKSKQFGAIQFLAKSRNRLRPQGRRGGGDVDQITVVRNDRGNPGLFQSSSEQRHFVTRQISSAPLAGRFRENLQRVAPAGLRAIDGTRKAAGNRHVRPEKWHKQNADW
jgi:hypothetical protein